QALAGRRADRGGPAGRRRARLPCRARRAPQQRLVLLRPRTGAARAGQGRRSGPRPRPLRRGVGPLRHADPGLALLTRPGYRDWRECPKPEAVPAIAHAHADAEHAMAATRAGLGNHRTNPSPATDPKYATPLNV